MNRYYEEATTETFYLESASILFGNNRRSQFRVDVKAQPVSSKKKKKKKREHRRQHAALRFTTACPYNSMVHGYRIYRIAFFSGATLFWPGCGPLPAGGEGEERFEKNDWDVIAFGNLYFWFLRLRFMERKLSCFCTFFSSFFFVSPEFQSTGRSTDFELFQRFVSLLERK